MTTEDEVLLASVAAVARCVPSLWALPHVLRRLNTLLDTSSRWTFADACALGSLDLLRRLARAEAVDAVQWAGDDLRLLRGARFSLGSIRAAQNGHLHVLMWLVSEYDDKTPVTRAVEEAAKAGHLEILQWLYDNCRSRTYWGGNGLSYAVEGNYLEIAKWLVERTTPPRSRRRMELAAKHGDMEMIRWIYPQAGSISTKTIANAAQGGHLDAIKFLAREYAFSLVSNNVDSAAANGHLETVEWMLDNYAGCTASAVNGAAANGHLDVLKWLHKNRTSASGASRWSNSMLWSYDAMNLAATNGHLEVVQWLQENRDEGCTSTAMDGAAANGYLDVVLWLHEHRAEGCSYVAMDGAAAGNHFHVVRWLHENRVEGCSIAAMDGAAGNGHLAMVQWLHTNRTEGCSKRAMDAAAAGGHLHVVKWLHVNRSEGCSTEAMDGAAKGGHFNVLTWLHTHRHEGCTPSAIDNAAGLGRLDIVRWLVERLGSGCTSRAVTSAAANGHLEVILYLDSVGMAQVEASAFVESARLGFAEIAQWFLKKRVHLNMEPAYHAAKNYNREYCMEWLYREGAGRRPYYVHSPVIIDATPREVMEYMIRNSQG